MAGYGAEPTLERLTDDACERRFVAALCARDQRSLHAVTSAPHKQRSIRESEYPCSASRRLSTSVRHPGYNYRHAGVAGLQSRWCALVGSDSTAPERESPATSRGRAPWFRRVRCAACAPEIFCHAPTAVTARGRGGTARATGNRGVICPVLEDHDVSTRRMSSRAYDLAAIRLLRPCKPDGPAQLELHPDARTQAVA